MIVRCVFIADEKDRDKKTCARKACGRVLRSPHPPEKCHATCRAFATEPKVAPRRSSLIVQFARAWWRYLRAGLPPTPVAHRLARLEVCVTCPHHAPRRWPLTWLASCRACGCFVRLKARWATEHCPRGKWPGDPPAPERTQCGCGG